MFIQLIPENYNTDDPLSYYASKTVDRCLMIWTQSFCRPSLQVSMQILTTILSITVYQLFLTR